MVVVTSQFAVPLWLCGERLGLVPTDGASVPDDPSAFRWLGGLSVVSVLWVVLSRLYSIYPLKIAATYQSGTAWSSLSSLVRDTYAKHADTGLVRDRLFALYKSYQPMDALLLACKLVPLAPVLL